MSRLHKKVSRYTKLHTNKFLDFLLFWSDLESGIKSLGHSQGLVKSFPESSTGSARQGKIARGTSENKITGTSMAGLTPTAVGDLACEWGSADEHMHAHFQYFSAVAHN